MVDLQVLVRQPAAALDFFPIFPNLAFYLSLLFLIIQKLVRRLSFRLDDFESVVVRVIERRGPSRIAVAAGKGFPVRTHEQILLASAVSERTKIGP